MAITFARTPYSGKQQVFWRGESKVLPAGFKPNQTFSVGTILKRGALVAVKFDDLTADIVKVGTVITGGTTTKPRVSKDNYFEVGDKVMKVGDTAAKTISSIDRSNADYDVITLNSAITGLAAGDFIVESDEAAGYYDAASTDEGALKVVASGASTGQINLADVTPYKGTKTLAANDYVVLKSNAPKFSPNAVLTEDKEILANDITTLDCAYGAVVIKDVVPAFPDAWLTGGICLTNNPNIVYIRQ